MATANIGRVLREYQNTGWDACGTTMTVCDYEYHYEIDNSMSVSAKRGNSCTCKKAFITPSEIIIDSKSFKFR